MTVVLAGALVELHDDGLTLTRYRPGVEVHARPHDTDEYRARAAALGYGADTARMSRDHELCHGLVSEALGLPHSPTLMGVATGRHHPAWREEEAAVLAVQRLAVALGVDCAALAARPRPAGGVA